MSEHTHGIEGFETWVDVAPSFHMIRDNPARNYGIGNVRIWFYLKTEVTR